MKIPKLKPLISPAGKAALAASLRQRYPHGPFETNNVIYAARELTVTTIFGLDDHLKNEGSPLTLSVDTDHSRYMPLSSTGGAGLVKALIVFDGTAPIFRDLSIAPTLIRLQGKPIFIDHPDGAVQLLDALIKEIEEIAASLDVAATPLS